MSKAVTVTLTERELTLIRVACLARLDRLTRAMEGYNPLNAGDAERLKDLQASYDETKALLNGKLWDAR
jgi:hypothetical protein